MSATSYRPLMIQASQAWGALKDYLSDERMAQYPSLATLSNKVDRPPSVLAHSILLAILSVLLLNPYKLSNIIVNSLALLGLVRLTLVYLATLSEDACPKSPPVPKPTKQWSSSTRRLLDYWVVYSTSIFLESTFEEDTLMALVPLWWAFKGLTVVWFLMGSGERKERPKPEPLRLKPRPTVVQNRTPQTSYADESSVSSAATTAIDSGLFTGPTPSSAQLREMKRELHEISPGSPSKTPENLKHKTSPAETPVSGKSGSGSEPFGLSGNSDTESDTESESDSSYDDSESGSEFDSSSAPGSAATDDSNDDLLSPGTVLNSVALEGTGGKEPAVETDERQKKTIEEQAPRGGDKLEATFPASKLQESVPEVVDLPQNVPEDTEVMATQKAPQRPDVPRDIPVPSPSTLPEQAQQEVQSRQEDPLPIELTPAQNLPIQAKAPSPVLAPHVTPPNAATHPPSARLVDDEGSVTRLTLDDLLAMDPGSESELPSAGILEGGKNVEGNVVEAIVQRNGAAVAKGFEPLNIHKPLREQVGAEAESLL
ncbi:hypothetical protein IAR50_007165 [Cryptococcus sp. DSM 104548]